MRTRNIITITLAGLAIAGLTACGTTAATSSGTKPPAAATQQQAPAAITPEQVARQIGATGVERMDPSMYASAEATATWQGKPVIITTFASQQLRDNWTKVAGQFGPILKTGQWWAMIDGVAAAPAEAAKTAQPEPAQATQPAQPKAPEAPKLTSGVAVVLQYYQDVSDGNYQAAWAIGGKNLAALTGQSYSSWVAGYSETTASIDVTSYGTWSSGTVWTNISAVQLDGSVRNYYGTYTVTNGVITGANIRQA